MSDRLIGQTLGDYRVVDVLGQGSMARVYRAQQLSLKRQVALKVFQEGLLTPGDLVERFEREAVYLAQFEHPNILPVYGAGKEGELHYFALRLVEGGTLADWILSRPSARATYSVLRDVAAGMAALHAKGGVHRDLKPTNVLVEEGRGILADFGLARMLEDSTITQSGAMMGTPAYLSPEQWRREKATPASDVFSFGVVLHEALSGRHPFYVPAAGGASSKGEALREALHARLSTGVFPPIGRDGVPAGIDAVVRRCLKIDPAERYADLRQVERALDAVKWPREEDAEQTARLGSGTSPTVEVSMPPPAAVAPTVHPPTAPSVAAPPEGTPFGRYFLRGELGTGGMGIVYRAWDPTLSREVALKVLRAGEMAGAEDVQRFEREARSAAGLRHAGIISVHEVGVETGRHYFTMDLVEGRSLREVLEKEVPPLEEALRLLVQVARAVDYAHGKGIVHRDLKPANVLVEGRDRALVGDFGLARNVAAGDGVTVTRTVMGTPAYMSPEQARGGAVDALSDVYSLGAMLYEMLTRRPPFEGEAAMQVLSQVLFEEPAPPRKANPMVPRDLEVICQKAMEKDAGRRYASAADLADDVERYLRREPIRARPASRWYRFTRRVARNPAAFIAAAVALLIALGAAGMWEKRRWQAAAEARDLRPLAGKDYEEGRLEDAARRYQRIAELAPDDASARDRAADCATRLRAIDEIRPLTLSPNMSVRAQALTRILALNSGLAWAWRERGLCSFHDGAFGAARGDFHRAIELDPNDAAAHVGLAEVAVRLGGDTEEALAQLGIAAKNDQYHYFAAYTEAAILMERGRWKEAVAGFDEVLRSQPGFAPALLNRAACKERLDDLDGAWTDVNAAIDADRHYARGFALRAKLKLYERSDRAGAETDARVAASLSEGDPEVSVVLGNVLEEKGLEEEARAAYDQAVSAAPPNADAFAARGRFRVKNHRLEEGMSDLERSLAIDPRHASALGARGLAWQDQGEFAKAEADYKAALEVEPRNLDALGNYGALLVKTGRAQQGLDTLDAAIAREKRWPLLYVNRALALCALQRFDAAEDDYRKATQLDPKCGVAHYGLAQRMMVKSAWQDAIREFTAAIENGYVEGYYNRGVCKCNLNDFEGARADFENTVKLDPKHKKSAEDGLRQIQAQPKK